LGLNLPTYNWWKLLQMDPEELRQQLSTQEVAALRCGKVDIGTL